MAIKSQALQTKSQEIPTPKAADRFLRFPAVQERTGLAISTVYDWMRKGLFPQARQLGPRNVAWLESEIDSWMCTRQPVR
ncbi:MAG: AlpA family transcriptional regulator [Magnetococcales bacterium]|nr:AlpA family transcriptional regulator [Magnetococcales bacterium]MBF0261983.1 AlpA family transcriptional regulator [Magnetococcales bacterium]